MAISYDCDVLRCRNLIQWDPISLVCEHFDNQVDVNHPMHTIQLVKWFWPYVTLLCNSFYSYWLEYLNRRTVESPNLLVRQRTNNSLKTI